MADATPLEERDDTRYSVPGLEKGLNLLLLFGKQRGELSFSEICQRTGLSKATAYRTLQTLENMNFLQRTHGGGYTLGISILRLGFDYLGSLDIVEIGQPVIHHLRNATGYSAHLCLLDEREVVYVARAGAVGEITPGVGVGSRLPAHCTAIGRVLLMELPRERLQKLFPESVFAMTSEKGPKTPKQLFALLEEDRKRGYAISESFYQPGVSAVVYPLRNRQEEVFAAVSVMVPKSALPTPLKKQLCSEVAQAAADIEKFLR